MENLGVPQVKIDDIDNPKLTKKDLDHSKSTSNLGKDMSKSIDLRKSAKPQFLKVDSKKNQVEIGIMKSANKTERTGSQSHKMQERDRGVSAYDNMQESFKNVTKPF